MRGKKAISLLFIFILVINHITMEPKALLANVKSEVGIKEYVLKPGEACTIVDNEYNDYGDDMVTIDDIGEENNELEIAKYEKAGYLKVVRYIKKETSIWDYRVVIYNNGKRNRKIYIKEGSTANITFQKGAKNIIHSVTLNPGQVMNYKASEKEKKMFNHDLKPSESDFIYYENDDKYVINEEGPVRYLNEINSFQCKNISKAPIKINVPYEGRDNYSIGNGEIIESIRFNPQEVYVVNGNPKEDMKNVVFEKANDYFLARVHGDDYKYIGEDAIIPGMMMLQGRTKFTVRLNKELILKTKKGYGRWITTRYDLNFSGGVDIVDLSTLSSVYGKKLGTNDHKDIFLYDLVSKGTEKIVDIFDIVFLARRI